MSNQMPKTPVVPSTIKNKIKREQVYNRQKKQKAILDKDAKMQRRREERENPELKKVSDGWVVGV